MSCDIHTLLCLPKRKCPLKQSPGDSATKIHESRERYISMLPKRCSKKITNRFQISQSSKVAPFLPLFNFCKQKKCEKPLKNKGSRTLIQVPPAAFLELFKYFQITPKAFKTRLFLISLIQINTTFFKLFYIYFHNKISF